MPETSLLQQIVQKIESSILLKPEKKQKLLAEINNFTPDELNALNAILSRGIQGEQDILSRIVESMPDFPQKFKQSLNQQIRKGSKKEEEHERKSETSQGEDLLKELDSV